MLVSHALTVWGRVIEQKAEEGDSMGGEPERGRMDATFAAGRLMEKHRETQNELYVVFVDLEKAYDRVPTRTLIRTRIFI